jgi:hypothetical protein
MGKDTEGSDCGLVSGITTCLKAVTKVSKTSGFYNTLLPHTTA